MIRVHGKELGIEKYNSWKHDIGYFNTLEGKIEKYGSIIGLQKYSSWNAAKHNNNLKHYSNKSKLFFEILINKIGKDKYTYYFADNEWFVSFPGKIYFIDFFIKELNYGIEFNGDFWHCNPKFYNGSEITFRGNLAKDVWDKDEKRLNDLRQRIKNLDVVWEYDYDNNLDNLLLSIVNHIKEIENNVL